MGKIIYESSIERFSSHSKSNYKGVMQHSRKKTSEYWSFVCCTQVKGSESTREPTESVLLNLQVKLFFQYKGIRGRQWNDDGSKLSTTLYIWGL